MHADSTLHIDLGAIGHNAAAFAASLRPGGALCGVVKADAYGLGAHAVAGVLEQAGWSMLAVHRIDEALALLHATSLPLLVLGPVRGLSPMHPLAAPLAEGRVHLVAQDAEAVDDARTLGHAMGRPINVHLEIDTAMGRGVTPAAVGNLLRGMLADPRLHTAGVMTHFASSAHASATAAQFQRFDQCLLPMRRRLPRTCLRHCAATTASLRDPGVRCDMMRIGLGWAGHAVGIESPHVDGQPLAGAVRWTAAVAAVRELPAGTSVGYGSRFVCPRDMRVAMLPVGYADGLPVQATGHALQVINDAAAWVGAATIIGAVSMDQVLLDVTHLPAGRVRVGTQVEVFGPDTLSRFASDLGLQPHHLLTAIGPRVHRRLVEPVRLAAGGMPAAG